MAYQGRAVLIIGGSGSGKSTLALQLMSMGCDLVADDRTDIYPDLTVQAPAAIHGLIEARGIGILRAQAVSAQLLLVVDLDRTETERLPQTRHTTYHKHAIPLIYGVTGVHFPYGILQYLKEGRQD